MRLSLVKVKKDVGLLDHGVFEFNSSAELLKWIRSKEKIKTKIPKKLTNLSELQGDLDLIQDYINDLLDINGSESYHLILIRD